MTRVVLDCSMAMSWCFEDEGDERSERVLASIMAGEAVVPSHWPLEVANVLANCERQKRIGARDIATFVEMLRSYPIVIDEQTAGKAFGDVLSLARMHRLSAYDAAYLELALREGSSLASFDAPLNKAAAKLGISLFEG